jgi:hypothetical protein
MEEDAVEALAQRGLSDIAVAIDYYWGERCKVNEPGCATCHAWAIYDCMVSLTSPEIAEDMTNRDYDKDAKDKSDPQQDKAAEDAAREASIKERQDTIRERQNEDKK